MTRNSGPWTVENIAKLKGEVERRLTELRCRLSEESHKLVSNLVQSARFDETALGQIANMSATVEALKLLLPVFDGQIIRAKTDEIDRELSAARERLAAIGTEVAEARRDVYAVLSAPSRPLTLLGKLISATAAGVRLRSPLPHSALNTQDSSAEIPVPRAATLTRHRVQSTSPSPTTTIWTTTKSHCRARVYADRARPCPSSAMFANETNLDDAIEIVDAAILAALVELETAEKAPRPVSVDGRNLRAIEAHDQAILNRRAKLRQLQNERNALEARVALVRRSGSTDGANVS